MKPIRSKRDLEQARKSLHELRQQLAMLKKAYRHDREAYELATRGLRELAHETAHAIAAYEQAAAGRLPAAVGARNPRTGQLELPRVLRSLRRAAGLDQTGLAARLGTHQSDISRWEREGYDRYNLQHLQRLADVLGYDLEVTFLKRDPPKGEPSP
jgi:DNA-binding transcriptional regulator YiaG